MRTRVKFTLMTTLIAVVLLLAGFATTAYAAYDFPSDDSDVIASVGFVDASQVGYFWSVARGDSVVETFTTDFMYVDRIKLHLEVITNVLAPMAYTDWDVLVNGTVVGSFTVIQGYMGPVHVDEVFPPMVGPEYVVELKVTNEVAGGAGSISLAYADPYAHMLEFMGVRNADIDIKPMSWPNPVNVSSKGVVPVAVMGSEMFDATMIDPMSVTLAGIAPVKWSMDDVDYDGYMDMVFHFDTQALVAALGSVADGDSLWLSMMGITSDGNVFYGEDMIHVLVKGK